ncbi:hypothetical protein MHYP_G00052910 [Metynnis hypsauchen]
MQKRTPDGQLVKQKMDMTFALRRKEVVESEPAISKMVERWPALFTEDQVYMEFNWILSRQTRIKSQLMFGHWCSEGFRLSLVTIPQTSTKQALTLMTHSAILGLGSSSFGMKLLCSHPYISSQPH